MFTVITAAWVSAVAALVSGLFAWLAYVHSKRAHSDLKSFENQRLELEKERRREDREEAARAREEAAAREARAASEKRVQKFIECMASKNVTGMGTCLECGLAALDSDEEIRRANELYKARSGRSVFFKLEHLFEDIDTKAFLVKWQSMHPKEQQHVGGLEAFLKPWPKKSQD